METNHWVDDVMGRLLDERTSHALQAAQVPYLSRNLYASEEARRDAMIRGMQKSLPRSAGTRALSDPARVEPIFRQQFEAAVCDAVFAAARQSPTLRPIISVDRTGREMTEFLGQKRSWMQAYSDPPKLMTAIGGAPPVIPVVL